MTRTVLIFGSISGLITITGIMLTFLLPNAHGSVWLGYLIMIVALSMILFGVKRYRDNEQGGVIKFLPALGLGLMIAVVAGIIYVAVWEFYLFVTHYTFMDHYTAAILAQKKAAGMSGAERDESGIQQPDHAHGHDVHRDIPGGRAARADLGGAVAQSESAAG